MQTGKPHHWWFFDLGPLIVLFDSIGEVGHPTAEFLLGLRGKLGPSCRQVAVLKRKGKLIQLRAHTDFSLKCTLQVDECVLHSFDQVVESF